jgi:hypothetical protein
MNKLLLLIPVVAALVIFFFLSSSPKGIVIGGDKDKGGCLVAAGYAYDEHVRACTRSWELDEDKENAATLAVDSVGPSYGLTVTGVEVNECDGCFTVTLRSGDIEIVKELSGWAVVTE